MRSKHIYRIVALFWVSTIQQPMLAQASVGVFTLSPGFFGISDGATT